MKRKGSGSSTKKNKTQSDVNHDTMQLSQDNLENSREHVANKRPRRAAACTNFKEKSVRLYEPSMVETKNNYVEAEEVDAVLLTKVGPEYDRPCRKLVDFIMYDADGNMQPFEMSGFVDCFMTAFIMPLEDDMKKGKQRRVFCPDFGRVESWSISGYEEGFPIVWVATETTDYECVKPARKYKNSYDLFHEKARFCVEVYRKLAKSKGGNPNASLEELLAAVVRSMSTKSFSSGLMSRDFVISQGVFIYNQLIGLEKTPDDSDEGLATLPALLALREECKKRLESNKLCTKVIGGSLMIKEGENDEGKKDEDVKLALLLQEEQDFKMRKQHNRRSAKSQNNIYIKIDEAEIAHDYPLPTYYKPSVQEEDEYLFFQSDYSMSVSDLPRRILNNWSLYNSDTRLVSLEHLPMKPCAETDAVVFGSGNMRNDDGSGYDPENYGTSNSSDTEGIPIYLSALKEWKIEFGAEFIDISIRTDVAWYRLGRPRKQYAPWYGPVLKTARLARSIIALLQQESRVAKLPFASVVKKISAFEKDNPSYVSSNVELVERYLVVHGQIFLQQFSGYPDPKIRKCAFVTGLSDMMKERCHAALIMKKKISVKKEVNLNPIATMRPVLSKRNVMRATTTRLINRIWGGYYSNHFPEDLKEREGQESKELEDEQEENGGGEEEEEEDDDDEAEEGEEQKALLLQDNYYLKIDSSMKSDKYSRFRNKEITWEGEVTGKMDSGEALYGHAFVRGAVISVGGSVTKETEDLDPAIYFVEYMLQKHDGTKMAHVRVMSRGSQTILGNAANERELFLTNECVDLDLRDVKESVTVDIRSRSWGHKYRQEYARADKIDRAKAEERKKKGLPVEFYCKSLYWPERGAFFDLPYDRLGLGTGLCHSCKQRETHKDEFRISSMTSFVYKKTEYDVNDFVYARPQFFAAKNEVRGTPKFKGGRNVGLKAYVVCKVLGIESPSGSNQPTPESTKVEVRRFYRPEDISSEKAYSSDIREVYYSEEFLSMPVEMIEGRCEVRNKSDLPSLTIPVIFDHVFFCEYSYDSVNGSLKQLPINVKLAILTPIVDNTARRNKGKEKCNDEQGDVDQMKDAPRENCLRTLDIFSGCGGLSEGLQQSGASITKWAIEYEQPAGEAFSLNHPDALTFIDNCNVILRAIMEKGGDADDCVSTAEADELAAELNDEKLNNLPRPGQVEFINGGPPCQGFSGMNRFNQGTWSKVQCEMILAFLSFAEYFRPRFFLLENVRNFVSFNKGETFRLTLASLLEMGYQVRFGILEAGTYGVSQSRKRAFIWAASPGELLPEWPEPMHVFAGPELKISLPGGSNYAAVPSTAGGAPFRSTTVKDAIGDLPPIANGASKVTMDYGSEPVSWFQKSIRWNMLALNDHISKEMSELNNIRCQRIPKRAGADWRDLPDEKVQLSNGNKVDLIPWCLPNTAKKHNQWKGLFGRLDWEGNFPTSITDPQPMGKVGMCFHPDQDRIISVRECARSQGFPDSYQFFGNINNKHRQIGNAVPPPLAYALGRKLKEAISAKNLSD